LPDVARQDAALARINVKVASPARAASDGPIAAARDGIAHKIDPRLIN
jgi:hypothetical protein